MEKLAEVKHEGQNPRQYLEGVMSELELLAAFAKACNTQPVIVLIDGSSPWATRSKLLLSAVSIQTELISGDGYLKGVGDWTICKIAAKSAPALAEFLLDPPTDPSRIKVVMFHQTETGLRIACSDFLPDEYLWH